MRASRPYAQRDARLIFVDGRSESESDVSISSRIAVNFTFATTAVVRARCCPLSYLLCAECVTWDDKTFPHLPAPAKQTDDSRHAPDRFSTKGSSTSTEGLCAIDRQRDALPHSFTERRLHGLPPPQATPIRSSATRHLAHILLRHRERR